MVPTHMTEKRQHERHSYSSDFRILQIFALTLCLPRYKFRIINVTLNSKQTHPPPLPSPRKKQNKTNKQKRKNQKLKEYTMQIMCYIYESTCILCFLYKNVTLNDKNVHSLFYTSFLCQTDYNTPIIARCQHILTYPL